MRFLRGLILRKQSLRQLHCDRVYRHRCVRHGFRKPLHDCQGALVQPFALLG